MAPLSNWYLAPTRACVLSQLASRSGRLTTGTPRSAHTNGCSTQSLFTFSRELPEYSIASPCTSRLPNTRESESPTFDFFANASL
jgi:hypothetical protein